jgi:signal transduction histidine kinase
MDNAIRYTPRMGRIVLAAVSSESQVQLRVGNTGPAIPAAKRETIFEKFGQLTQSGYRTNLGLGLYFCRLAIEAHGGRMWVDESPELPTVFCIDLPRAAA